MCARSNGWILLAATATLVMAGCSAPPQGDIDARITTTIDETLEPGPDLPPAPDGGARRLAASTFDGEPQSDFVVNELIVVPADPQELDALLADWGGELLSAIEVVGGPIRFHVRVDTSLVDVSDADDVLSELALGSGALVVSEESALELLVLAAKATAAGVDVDLVWMVSPQTFEDGSQEDGLDAMNLDYMRANSDLGIGVDEAWLALERAGALDDPDRSVDLGVIDGGFYDNDDFSPAATHTSFVSGAPGLNAPNPANCGKNNPCPRHGTGSALSMAGLADNGFGADGPQDLQPDAVCQPEIQEARPRDLH